MFYQISKPLPFFTFLFLLLYSTQVAFAQRKDQLKNSVTINLPPDSLIKTLLRLEAYTKTNFAFDPDQLRAKKTAGNKFIQVPLGAVLDKLLFGSGLGYNLVGNDVVIIPKKTDPLTIHGHVRDKSNGEELVSATVQIPSLEVGVNTNQYGFYSLSVPEGDYQLVISNPGYQSQQLRLHLERDQQVEIELSLQEHQLEEVVIGNSKLHLIQYC